MWRFILALTVPRFLSACSGSPTLLRDSDISTEYPSDVDDESLTEQGFSPALPDELTKISSALALFKICRILSRSLDQLLPASACYQFSMNSLNCIADELEEWVQSIPTHLRMKFLNDKPSTGLISDRSPLLVCMHIVTLLFWH
jgi:Fungal specific transcription factor domain